MTPEKKIKTGIMHIRTDDGRSIAVAMRDVTAFSVGARVVIAIRNEETQGIVTLTEEKDIHAIRDEEKERYT